MESSLVSFSDPPVIVMKKLVLGATMVCAATACVTAAILVRRRVKNSGNWARVLEILRKLDEKCATPTGKLRQVADAMAVEMHAGLASEGGSNLKMILSYVDSLPTG